MPDLEFLKQPWEIQVMLASGYASYLAAYTGLRDRQRAIDVAFVSLAFGLVATLVLWLLISTGPIISSAAAFVASLVVGLAWRKFGRPLAFATLRAMNITWSDDEPSALASLCNNTRHRMSQIAVELDDGTWLSCNDAARFANAPFGPCHIGPNGDVALYLTHEQRPNSTERELGTVRDAHYGDRVTWVPASRIKQMTMRHIPKSSRSSREGAGARSDQSPAPSAA
jgi:hypothetical protein